LAQILCALFLFAFLPAQDEARTLAALDKAFTPPPKGKATLDEQSAALAATAGLDSAKVAAALVDAWSAVAATLADIDTQREAVAKEVAVLEAEAEANGRTLPMDKHKRLTALKPDLATWRTRSDDMQALLAKVGLRIGELRRRDSALWLLQRAVPNKKLPLPLKLAAAKALGATAGEIGEDLANALTRTKETDEQVVLLDALGQAGRAAQAFATPALALLASKEEVVAERAALALAKLAVADAIGPMIELLARLDGQTRIRVGGALEVLTGQQFGIHVASWQAWFQAEGAAFAASGKAGTGSRSKPKGSDKYYFGIPQDQSHSILYVIDCSGSMTAKVQLPGTQRETTRIEASKAELVRALEKLKPDQKFAILWYNHEPHFWEPKLQLASKEAVTRAQAFVKTLQAAGSTNIFESLERGFGLVGRGARDKYYGMELDTIFLMTDGSPTRPDGQLDSTDKILAGVRAWNPLQRVTIHCIAIGKDLNVQFLRQLAEENGGEFKQF
jgi:hypothetical protein